MTDVLDYELLVGAVVRARDDYALEYFFWVHPPRRSYLCHPLRPECALRVDVDDTRVEAALVGRQLHLAAEGVTDLGLSGSELSVKLGYRPGLESTTKKLIQVLRTRRDLLDALSLYKEI